MDFDAAPHREVAIGLYEHAPFGDVARQAGEEVRIGLEPDGDRKRHAGVGAVLFATRGRIRRGVRAEGRIAVRMRSRRVFEERGGDRRDDRPDDLLGRRCHRGTRTRLRVDPMEALPLLLLSFAPHARASCKKQAERDSPSRDARRHGPAALRSSGSRARKCHARPRFPGDERRLIRVPRRRLQRDRTGPHPPDYVGAPRRELRRGIAKRRRIGGRAPPRGRRRFLLVHLRHRLRRRDEEQLLRQRLHGSGQPRVGRRLQGVVRLRDEAGLSDAFHVNDSRTVRCGATTHKSSSFARAARGSPRRVDASGVDSLLAAATLRDARLAARTVCSFPSPG